ncbi:hypothetical protein ACOTTU_24330 [Roseobacter sp. EG26]|uniref:hypothetical protein n=1 Tax=Roseobacter sp. EG26 TaxID=3412477 RepID=UPI003CE57FBE
MSDRHKRLSSLIVWIDDRESSNGWSDDLDRHLRLDSDQPKYCLDYSELATRLYNGNVIDELTLEKLRKSAVGDSYWAPESLFTVDLMMKGPLLYPSDLKRFKFITGKNATDRITATHPSSEMSAFSLGMVFAKPEEIEDQLESLDAIYRYHCCRLGHRRASFLMNWHLFLTVVCRAWMSLPVVKSINAVVQKWTGANS